MIQGTKVGGQCPQCGSTKKTAATLTVCMDCGMEVDGKYSQCTNCGSTNIYHRRVTICARCGYRFRGG